MATDPDSHQWSIKVRGGHVRLRWVDRETVQATLHGLLMDVSGTLVRPRARSQTAKGALNALWDTIAPWPLIEDDSCHEREAHDPT